MHMISCHAYRYMTHQFSRIMQKHNIIRDAFVGTLAQCFDALSNATQFYPPNPVGAYIKVQRHPRREP